MEEKKKWNLAVYLSIAEGVDKLAETEFRGDKGLTTSAAGLMLLLAPRAVRQRYIDAIKLAEARGMNGTMLEAAKDLIAELEARDGEPAGRIDPGRSQRRPATAASRNPDKDK